MQAQKTSVPAALLRGLAGAAALLASLHAGAQQAQPKLDTVTLAAGMHSIKAEVARSEEERETGLMGRTKMEPYEGMLFVFEDSAIHCFWMKNTLLPLSAAFIADDGTIVTIADMQPQTLASHCPAKPVRYVLEMNQGWFAKRGIKTGFALSGPPFHK